MELLLGSADKAQRNLIDKFRQKKIFSLMKSEHDELVLEEVSVIQHKIVEALGIGCSIQDVKIQIMDCMSDEEILKYIEMDDPANKALNKKLHRIVNNIRKRDIGAIAISNTIESLGLDIEFYSY